MNKPAFDPGLTRQFGAKLRRAVNKDGSYNVRREGVSWRAYHPWAHVVSMSWARFALVVVCYYVGVNTLFALVYYAMPANSILGSQADTRFGRLMNDFFFSGHTLTTVGYGTLAPHGVMANIVATAEALVGLLGFAVITGLLVARASRPSARIRFSEKALIAPYQDGRALMFRIANERSNSSLIEVEARVMLMQVVKVTTSAERKFDFLTLERENVMMLPLTWTVVHPIDDSSPLNGKTHEDLRNLQAELLISVKAFDETFSQVVHTRFSYTFEEIEWDAKFVPAFTVTGEGDLLLNVAQLGAHEHLPRQ